MQPLRFSDYLHPRPASSGFDVTCKLQHFVIVTYAVEPVRFGGMLPDRFELDLVEINGKARALVSVVPFVDVDFTAASFLFPKFTMGQTNYRVYIVDRETGEKCVWFIGTTLDSWTLVVPRHLWKLPWHRGAVRFDCAFDDATGLYESYEMQTDSDWAPAKLRINQPENATLELAGFPDLETGLVFLTHPLAGFYYRRDGKLGSYRVWHDRLQVRPAALVEASFGLLDQMNIVSGTEQADPHSVLVDPLCEFTIYLPPKVLR